MIRMGRVAGLLLLGSVAHADDVPQVFGVGVGVETPRTAIRACKEGPGALPVGMEEARRRTVRIETSLGTGSGFFVSPDGFVATAAHVVGGAETVQVVLEDGSRMDGQVVRTKGQADLALVRVAVETPCFALSADRAPIGADVFIIGSPQGEALTHTVTKGIVSAYRDVDGYAVLQTDASLSGGNSGGIVVNTDGAALGVVSFKAVGLGVEGLGFAMGVENLEEALSVSWSETTAETVEVWRETGELGTSTAEVSAAEVTNRPASPEPPLEAKKACKKADLSSDPFSGSSLMTYDVPGQFVLTVRDGEPTVRLEIGAAAAMSRGFNLADPAVAGPGGTTIDLLLQDGTRIKALSTDVGTRAYAFGASFVMGVRLDRDAIDALASSPPTILRFSAGKTQLDVEKDKGDHKESLGKP